MKLEKIQIFDIFSCCLTLSSLFLIPVNYNFWLLYSLACLCYIIIHKRKGLYGGMIMNIVGMIIGVINWVRYIL